MRGLVLFSMGLIFLFLAASLWLWQYLSFKFLSQELHHLELLLETMEIKRPFHRDGILVCLLGPGKTPCPWNSKALEHDQKLVRETESVVVNLQQGYLLKPQGKDLVLLKISNSLPVSTPWPWWGLVAGAVACLLLSYVYQKKERQEEKICCAWLADWVGKDLQGKALLRAADEKEEQMRRLLVERENDLWQLRQKYQDLQQKLRKMQEDLAMAQQTLLQTGSLSALGEFAAAISHELNNPLGIILGFTQHLLEEIAPDHPHYPKLKRIEIELERCQRIIRDLLTFARPAQPHRKEIDINEFLEELVRFIFFEKPEGVQLECFLEEGLPRIWIDPEQLEQVILNLTKNAIEAMAGKGTLTIVTRKGQLTRRDCFELALPITQPGALDLVRPSQESGRIPQLKTEYQPGDPAVIIEVTDTGPGIPEEIREKIFNPFFTTKKGGTGLGLSICWKLIRRNGGLLRCQSSPGKGTSFLIILPVNKEREDGREA